MAGHPAYEGRWGCPCQAHYLLQLVYIYRFRVKGHHKLEVSMSQNMGGLCVGSDWGGWGWRGEGQGLRREQIQGEDEGGRQMCAE